MRPLLIDEGLPSTVAKAFSILRLTAHAVGEPDAPPRASSDDDNCAWCQKHGAVLVTNDRGRADKTIFNHLAQRHVHAISYTRIYETVLIISSQRRFSLQSRRWKRKQQGTCCTTGFGSGVDLRSARAMPARLRGFTGDRGRPSFILYSEG